MTRLGVSNYFVNTMVTALQGPEWERLLKRQAYTHSFVLQTPSDDTSMRPRIGEDAMFHLLTETCLFAPLPNDCLCQMTGEPIVYMRVPLFKRALEPAAAAAVDERIRAKRKAQGPPEGGSARKRMRLADGSASSSRTNSANALFEEKLTANMHVVFRSNVLPRLVLTLLDSRTAADVSIARSRLFYARPSFVPHKHHIIVGLPSKRMPSIYVLHVPLLTPTTKIY